MSAASPGSAVSPESAASPWSSGSAGSAGPPGSPGPDSGTRASTVVNSISRWERYRRRVRLVMVVFACGLPSACMHRSVPPLLVSSLGSPMRLTGRFVGRTTIERDILTVHVDTARVRLRLMIPTDGATVEGVSVRAVVATDSAGRWIPMGVSSAADVADTMRDGEERVLWGLQLDVPLPPAARARDLWIVFQFRATARTTDGDPELVLTYACSETNLLGGTQGARARAKRLQGDYAAACQL